MTPNLALLSSLAGEFERKRDAKAADKDYVKLKGKCLLSDSGIFHSQIAVLAVSAVYCSVRSNKIVLTKTVELESQIEGKDMTQSQQAIMELDLTGGRDFDHQ